jgi:hypothetical protein
VGEQFHPECPGDSLSIGKNHDYGSENDFWEFFWILRIITKDASSYGAFHITNHTRLQMVAPKFSKMLIFENLVVNFTQSKQIK